MSKLTTEDYFRGMTREERQKEKAVYEELIANEKGELPPVKNWRTGKLMYKPKMPWMLPAWQSGLDKLNRIIAELDETKPKPIIDFEDEV